jgi:hypothetical protein
LGTIRDRRGERLLSAWPIGSVHSTEGRTMVKAVVLYGPPEDPDACVTVFFAEID